MKQLSALLSILLSAAGFSQQGAWIGGHIANYPHDSLKIVVNIDPIIRKNEVFYVPVVNGVFGKRIPVTHPVSIYTSEGSNYVSGLLEPGDSIAISYRADSMKTTLQVAGRGSEKFNYIRFVSDYGLYKKLVALGVKVRDQPQPFDRMFAFIDSSGNVFRQKLEAIRGTMGEPAFAFLQNDIEATLLSNRYSSVGLVFHEAMDETLEKRKASLTPVSAAQIRKLLSFNERLASSPSYVNAVFGILFKDYDSRLLAGKIEKALPMKYAYLDSLLPANLKTPVLTLFLDYELDQLNQAEDVEALIRRVYRNRADSVYRNYITRRFSAITSFKKGMAAPEFSVRDASGKTVSLADFRNKVVFLDFWYEACGPCHALFENMAALKKKFGSDSVVFLNISIDREDVWKNALKNNRIGGYHVFTANQETNHPVLKAYKVSSYPTTCLIDRNGKIFLATPSNNPAELERQIREALQQQ